MPGERVRITDVSPRDGLQNEPGVIATPDKVRLVELLSRTGVDEVEVSSFVSPKWVPQLGDAAEVFAGLGPKPPGVVYSALVPNDKGMDAALEVNHQAGSKVIDKVSLFTAASETFSKRNTNATIAESIQRWKPVLDKAAAEGLGVRAYVSCVFACPFEGEMKVRQVVDVVRHVLGSLSHSDYWPLEVSGFSSVELALGDTVGAGTSGRTAALLEAVQAEAAWAEVAAGGGELVLHLHDTFGRATECVKAGLELGVRSFDGSVAGLGGCPYASTPGKRAPGNISTETLVRTVHDAGFATGVDVRRLEEAAAFACRVVGGTRASSPSPAEGRA